MSNSNKFYTRLFSILTFLIIFCIIADLIVPNFIVQNINAQSSTSSKIIDPKISSANQKILDKAKLEARISSYKEYNLNSTEINFIEDKSFDIDAINLKVDKYVTYDKNGVATFNMNKYRIDPTVKLSKSNTEKVITIVSKMISKYNFDLKNTGSTKNSSKIVSSGVNNNDSTGINVTKTIVLRGFEVNVKIDPNQVSNIRAATLIYGPCQPKVIYFNYLRTWWGYTSATSALNGCAVDFVKDTFDGAIWAIGAVTAICSAMSAGLCAGIGLAVGTFAGGVSWSMYYYNKWYCNGNGIAIKLKAQELLLMYTPLKAAMYYQCS